MPALLLRFAIVLENLSIAPFDTATGERRHGPLFHRWLPTGAESGIDLTVDFPEAELRVWFEPRGYVQDGRVKFDYERQELDSVTIAREDVLDAGPLIGILRISEVEAEPLAAIREFVTGDPAYVGFGRKIAATLFRPLSRLIDTLRTNYGQYWLNPIQEWNAREQSLGSYFSQVIQTRWSLDDGATWSDFLPDAPAFLREAGGSVAPYASLLTAGDWNDLQKSMSEGYTPKLAANLVSKAHHAVEFKDLVGAVLLAKVAVEAGLNEFLHRKTRLNRTLAERLDPFASLPLATRLATVATLTDALPVAEVESAIKLAEMYEKAIRDGWSPPANAGAELSRVLKTITSLLGGPDFKFPNYFTRADKAVVEAAPSPDEKSDSSTGN